MNWVWALPMTGAEKLVLLCLADHADNDGVCWPGLSAVSEKTGVSQRQVMRLVSKMSETGLLEIEKRKDAGQRQQTNRYRLDIDDARLRQKEVEPGDMVSPGNAQKPGDILAEPGDISGHSRVTIMSPGTTKNVRTTREPSIEPPARASAREQPLKIVDERIAGITDAMRDRWSRAYPGVNFDREIAKAEAWLAGPPRRRKTDLARFLGNWFSKAEPEAKHAGAGPPRSEARLCTKCGGPATIRLVDGRWFCREHDPV